MKWAVNTDKTLAGPVTLANFTNVDGGNGTAIHMAVVGTAVAGGLARGARRRIGAGISVAELIRTRALDRPVVSRTDATTIRELRRLGGLLKKVHLDSGGAYTRETASALTALRAAIVQLAGGDEGAS